MAATIGAVAIQNRGTLGGSLGNASPASDPAVVLLALDAGVELARREGRRIERRTLSLADFFTGYRATAARADELVTRSRFQRAPRRLAIRLPQGRARRAQAISKVVAAVGVSGRCPFGRSDRPARPSAARIAFGSVAATTVRAGPREALAGRSSTWPPPPRRAQRSSRTISGRSTTCVRRPTIAPWSPAGS
jgi:CO/xanthine dehydrogenase FAD-binding subunit